MADITWVDVTDLDSQLTAVGALTQTRILAYVNTALKSSEFGGDPSAKYDLARIYLAAHMGALDLMGQGLWTGQVTAETEGQLSRQYASNSPMGTDPLLDKTVHGQAFRSMLLRSPARVPSVL